MKIMSERRMQILERKLRIIICPLTIEEKVVVPNSALAADEIMITVYRCINGKTAQDGEQSPLVKDAATTPCSHYFAKTCPYYNSIR